MKIIISFEIKDDSLSRIEKQEELVEQLYNACYEWIVLGEPPHVEFIEKKKWMKDDPPFFNFDPDIDVN